MKNYFAGAPVSEPPKTAASAGPPALAKPIIAAKELFGRQPRFWAVTVQFLREVRVELKKVTWPSRAQTIGSTIVVIILVMIISLFLGMVDSGLATLVRLVLHR